MILLIDNYDSFVYNLARYLTELGCETRVVRNDAVTPDAVVRMNPQAIVLSPGPCTPAEAGVCVPLVRCVAGTIPLLGVCLGHQAIAVALGGRVSRAAVPVHGKRSQVWHPGTSLFAGLPNPLWVGRYHSLVPDPATLPDELEMLARTADGVCMAFAHREQPLWGVQFHPESILTEGGHRLLANFLRLSGVPAGPPPEGERPDGSEPRHREPDRFPVGISW